MPPSVTYGTSHCGLAKIPPYAFVMLLAAIVNVPCWSCALTPASNVVYAGKSFGLLLPVYCASKRYSIAEPGDL